MYTIKPIRTEADYQAALDRAEAIFQAQPGEPEFDELDVLTTLIEAYEARQYPISKPDEELGGLLHWLQSWYLGQCDGDWEHGYGIKILSTDNPGWSVEINIEGTLAEEMVMPYQLVEQSEQNWHGVSVGKTTFLGIGDPSKLAFLLARFKKLVETGL